MTPLRPRRLAALAALSVLCLLSLPPGLRADVDPAPVAGSGPWNLTIFHTNDEHGSFLPEPATWRDDKAPVGGIVALARHLAQERRSAAASILLDGGDFMTGSPLCDIQVDGVSGGGWVDMRNLVGYDAGVVGNHEFDLGRENARALARRSNYPVLAADILNEKGEPEFNPGPVILERGGLRVGVIGVSCADLFDVTANNRTAGLSLRDQEKVAREQIAQLDPKVDLIVLISHSGIGADKALARKLAGSGLDVIVGAHSHTRLKEPVVEGGILIVQAGSHLQYLGRLDLRVANHRVEGYEGHLVELTADDASAAPEAAAAAPLPPADPKLTALVATYKAKIDEEYGRVIGTLAVDWKRGGGESNIGDWITDALRARAGADVAFLNNGSIRKDLPAGPIRLIDIHEILPFANTLVTFDLTGEQIRAIAQRFADSAGAGEGGGVQMSGLSFGWRRVGDHVEVEDLRVGGQPVDPARTYKAAAADFVAMKAQQYLNLPPPQTKYVGLGVTDAVVEAVKQAGTISARVEGRMRRLGAEGGR